MRDKMQLTFRQSEGILRKNFTKVASSKEDGACCCMSCKNVIDAIFNVL